MKQKRLDEMTEQLSKAMHQARQMCKITADDAAVLLRIRPDELFEYERGLKRIPRDVLEHVFVMGYKMMQVRIMENRYRRQCNFFRKLKQSVAEVQ